MAEYKEFLDLHTNLSHSGLNSIGDNNFQLKLIKIIIDGEENFSEQIIDIIKAEYFDNSLVKIIVQHVLDYVGEFNAMPTFDILKNIINKKESANETQRKHALETAIGIEQIKITDKAYIQSSALEFCRKQAIKNGILKAADVWSKGDYNSVVTVINEAIKAGEPKNSGHDYIKDVVKRLTADNTRDAVPALDGLNAIIGGGLAGGELGVVLSPTGGGKSMVLVRFGVEAFKHKKNVLYYTFELKESIIATRIDSCLFKLPLSHIPEYSDVITRGMKDYEKDGGRIFIKEFPTGTATISNLRSHMKMLERDHNFTPDVVLVDYADIMKASTTYAEKRYNLTSLYEELRGLAGEMDVPIWTASQANREAIDSENFDLKSISESLGKAQTADIIVGVGRSPSQKQSKMASLLILKNRFGEDGLKIPLDFDTAYININPTTNKSDQNIKKNAHNLENQIAQDGVGFTRMD